MYLIKIFTVLTIYIISINSIEIDCKKNDWKKSFINQIKKINWENYELKPNDGSNSFKTYEFPVKEENDKEITKKPIVFKGFENNENDLYVQFLVIESYGYNLYYNSSNKKYEKTQISVKTPLYKKSVENKMSTTYPKISDLLDTCNNIKHEINNAKNQMKISWSYDSKKNFRKHIKLTFNLVKNEEKPLTNYDSLFQETKRLIMDKNTKMGIKNSDGILNLSFIEKPKIKIIENEKKLTSLKIQGEITLIQKEIKDGKIQDREVNKKLSSKEPLPIINSSYSLLNTFPDDLTYSGNGSDENPYKVEISKTFEKKISYIFEWIYE